MTNLLALGAPRAGETMIMVVIVGTITAVLVGLIFIFRNFFRNFWRPGTKAEALNCFYTVG